MTSVSAGHIIRELNKTEEAEMDENVLGELKKKESQVRRMSMCDKKIKIRG